MDTHAFHSSIERLAGAIAINVARAGADFTWEGVKRTSYPGSDVRNGVRLSLFEQADGMCAYCGDSLGHVWEDWHIGHIVSAHGRKGHGYVMGGDAVNVFAQHAACNYDAEHVHGFVIPVEAFARPDRLPSAAPTRGECFQRLNPRANDLMREAIELGLRDADGRYIPPGERAA